MKKEMTLKSGRKIIISQPTDPNEEWRKHVQERSEKYKADSSPERLTEEETRMLYNLFRRRKDGDLSVYAEQIEALNDTRLTEFFTSLPYAMVALGQYAGDKDIQAIVKAFSDITDFLLYIAELRDGYRSVADFLKEYSEAEMAYLY